MLAVESYIFDSIWDAAIATCEGSESSMAIIGPSGGSAGLCGGKIQLDMPQDVSGTQSHLAAGFIRDLRRHLRGSVSRENFQWMSSR